jgi:hypothetical protein
MRRSLLMSGIAILLAISAAAPAASVAQNRPAFGLAKPEVAASRVVACGFKSVRLLVDDELQEEVVEVLDEAAPSPEQLRCVASASLGSHHYVTFRSPIEQTYQALYWQMSGERDQADARARLATRGLLSRLPTYDPKSTDETFFARALERLCGPRASGALKPMRGRATFHEGALDTLTDEVTSDGRLDDDSLACLVDAAAASGYPLGFIGNEAYPQRP